jgi:hypothetical protein
VLSIGALSRATGVPVETLRTWERRYGFPAPVERIDSGHRRYPIECVERLRLVVRALGLGHKPSIVLPASSSALHDLLALGGRDEPRARVREAPRATGGSFVERSLDCVKRLDGEGLVQELDRAWNDLGTMDFLAGCLGPFLRALGESWSRGDIEVGHEHFASEYVREFLSMHWRPMSERAAGPRIVCATLSGEEHVLGLHMAATALSLAGARAIFLGANSRVEDVVLGVREQAADAVALSAGARREGAGARIATRLSGHRRRRGLRARTHRGQATERARRFRQVGAPASGPRRLTDRQRLRSSTDQRRRRAPRGIFAAPPALTLVQMLFNICSI